MARYYGTIEAGAEAAMAARLAKVRELRDRLIRESLKAGPAGGGSADTGGL